MRSQETLFLFGTAAALQGVALCIALLVHLQRLGREVRDVMYSMTAFTADSAAWCQWVLVVLLTICSLHLITVATPRPFP
jgi:hypothetical protein